ncbi:MAG: 5-formyltetrahydrofolate cyclo-ligase [Mediterraneibacter gnavus]
MCQRPADRQRVGDIQDRITEQVVSHPLFVQAKEIWCYVSMGKEVCTEQILVSAWRAGKNAVPKVTGKRGDEVLLHRIVE